MQHLGRLPEHCDTDYTINRSLLNLNRDPIGILGPPAGKHLKIIVSAVLSISIRCSQHSNASLTSKLNQPGPNLKIQIGPISRVRMTIVTHRMIVFLQIAPHHDNCARSRALNINVFVNY